MTPGDLRVAQAAFEQASRVAAEIAPARGSSSLQYVLARAKKEAVEAAVELQHADADNAALIRALQFKAQLYGRMIEFLKEAIDAGDEAAQILSQYDKDELADLLASKGEAGDV